MIIVMQQDHTLNYTNPWPITFEGAKIIHGKPDTPRIFGFTAEPGGAEIEVYSLELETPEAIIGLYPVFIGYDDRMYGEGLKIVDAHEFTGGGEGVTALALAERAGFDALAKLGLVPQDFTVVGTLEDADDFESPLTLVGVFPGALEGFIPWEGGFAITVQSLNGQAAVEQVLDLDRISLEQMITGG